MDPDPEGKRIQLVARIRVQERRNKYKIAPWNKEKEKKYMFLSAGWSRS
jgi:hypothetical protein